MLSDYVQIISSLGFPIAMCGAMGYYVKYITDQHREDTLRLQTEHKEAENKIIEAINNNTLVMTRICERMDMDGITDNTRDAKT